MVSKNWKESFDLKWLFSEKGNFLVDYFDPYRLRDEERDIKYFESLFDKDGYFIYELSELMSTIITEGWDFTCDAVKLFYAVEFARNTRNNYSPIYMWR